MTVQEVTQAVAHEIVATATKRIVKQQITEHTDVPSDSMRVWAASFVAGELVANASDKVTKPMIEKASAKITSWRNRKNQQEQEISEGGAA